MVDEYAKPSASEFSLESLPESIQKLLDVMIGIDPNFSLLNWITKKAEEDLELLAKDVEREKLQVKQRLHRLDCLLNRISPNKSLPGGQRNLFDCFDVPAPLNHLTQRIENLNDFEALHPATSFLDSAPGDCNDDPLLAITAQLLMVTAHEKSNGEEPWVTTEQLFNAMEGLDISENECEEALEYLLTIGQLHEIDDDCFIPED